MRSGAAAGHTGYFHETAFYGSDDEFVDIVRPFLRDGVEAGEPTVVACAERNTALLRRSLDCSSIRFLPGGDQYTRPAPTIRAYRALFADLVAGGAEQIRVVGDVPHPGTGAGWDGWLRYEAAVNVAYDHVPLWGLCPYDTRTAPAEVLEDVACTHPYVATADGDHRHNDAFTDPATVVDRRAGVGDPGGREADLELVDASPRAARAALVALAGGALDTAALDAAAVVASEVVANAWHHGRPPVSLRAWLDDRGLVVAVHDAGPGPTDPFVGWRPPPLSGARGRGLWIAHQLCTDVGIVRRDGCTVTFGVDASRPAPA